MVIGKIIKRKQVDLESSTYEEFRNVHNLFESLSINENRLNNTIMLAICKIQ